MSTSITKRYSNFDLLLSAASELCVEAYADKLLATDASPVSADPKKYRQTGKMIRKNQHVHMSPWKIVAVACLVAMSLAFTACMSIPKVRNAIWEVIVDTYDKYFGVKFENNAEGPVDYPTTIEKKVYASYVPEAVTCIVGVDQTSCYSLHYYTLNGDWLFSITQTTIAMGQETFWDNESQQCDEIEINHHSALFISDDNIPNWHRLVWNNSQYIIIIESFINSQDTVQQIAESVEFMP